MGLFLHDQGKWKEDGPKRTAAFEMIGQDESSLHADSIRTVEERLFIRRDYIVLMDNKFARAENVP